MPAEVNKDNCTGCGDCQDVCPSAAIKIEEKKAVVDPETCIDCNLCESECKQDAIKVK